MNGRQVMALKATIQRRYKDKDGTWKSSQSFSRNEIPLAIYCLQKGFEKIIETQANGGDENSSIDEETVI